MTPEEFELEAMVIKEYNDFLDGLRQEEEESWRSDARKRLAYIAEREAAQRKAEEAK